jgi:hypothetical protein
MILHNDLSFLALHIFPNRNYIVRIPVLKLDPQAMVHVSSPLLLDRISNQSFELVGLMYVIYHFVLDIIQLFQEEEQYHLYEDIDEVEKND